MVRRLESTYYLPLSLFYRIARDIELMTGSKPNIWWLICWKYISPVAILGTVYILDSKLLKFIYSEKASKFCEIFT